MTQVSNWSARAIKAWQDGLGGGKIRQNANESPWDLPADLKAEILTTMASLPFERYDFALRSQLAAALADYSGIPAEQIVLGNGADELIQVAMMALPKPGGRILITSPTFIVYPMTAAALGRPVVDVPLLKPGFCLDTAGILAAARPGDLVFVCRPNNPTGNVFPRDEVLDLVRKLNGRQVSVIVDEAYFEFAGETVAAHVLDPTMPNLVVLRTLSKAFRLAGLRIGYALAAAPLVKQLEVARLLYNLSASSTVAALGVLSRPSLASETAAAIRTLREALAQDLATLPGVTVYPSQTNFLLVDLPCATSAVVPRLADQGILIRDYPGEAGLERSVRISVGDAEANSRVVAALAAALAASTACQLGGAGR